MLSALEGRLGCAIDAQEKIVVFLAEYAAPDELLSRDIDKTIMNLNDEDKEEKIG